MDISIVFSSLAIHTNFTKHPTNHHRIQNARECGRSFVYCIGYYFCQIVRISAFTVLERRLRTLFATCSIS